MEKFAASENIFNRQMVARTVLDTLRQVKRGRRTGGKKWDRRWWTGDGGHEMKDRRQTTGDRRQETGDRRWEADEDGIQKETDDGRLKTGD